MRSRTGQLPVTVQESTIKIQGKCKGIGVGKEIDVNTCAAVS